MKDPDGLFASYIAQNLLCRITAVRIRVAQFKKQLMFKGRSTNEPVVSFRYILCPALYVRIRN